ncbi:MFS transporter [Sphingomonas floccifaciens]|uniref:MFS transporter n=1 Tax=Sphingomonas floccifaciens TaxID=1844115 RepID=A0ABW4N8P3_9SPHN
MTHARLKLALFLTYAVFAILLNSVGTVILQSIAHFGVDKVAASTLEAFKDLPIAVVSFLVASFLPCIGLRRGMIAGLALVSVACLAMPMLDSFAATRLLFLATGVSFALVKVAIYSFVGLLTDTPHAHAALLNAIEGVFMLGVLAGYWLFALFIDPADPAGAGWLRVYWWLAGIAGAAILLLLTVRFDERAAFAADDADARPATPSGEFVAMLRLVATPLILVFVASAFLYVLVEQGVGTWLPTINREVLGLSAPMSVQAASIFAAGLAAGRLGAGVVVRRTGWQALLIGCLVAMAMLLVLVLPLAEAEGGRTVTSWADAPPVAYLLPLIGLCMAPIYPTLNSAILSAMPKRTQASVVGLIVVFSALGGTTGSFIVGRAFAAVGGIQAIYAMLVPIAALLVLVGLLGRLRTRDQDTDSRSSHAV